LSSIADKIRKVLALAKSAAGTPEGDVARARAGKMLASQGWTESDVLQRDHILIAGDLPEIEEWKRSLLILVAEYTDSVVFETPEGAGIHGIEIEVAPHVLLFETLAHRIDVAAREFAEETLMLAPTTASSELWYAGFSYWAVMGLLERLVREEEGDEPREARDVIEGPTESSSSTLDDRVVLPEDDERLETPEWATLDQTEEAFQKLLEGDEAVLMYCREGYIFGQEVPLTRGIGTAPDYDTPLLLEDTCPAPSSTV
jgi:hypothetical protein